MSRALSSDRSGAAPATGSDLRSQADTLDRIEMVLKIGLIQLKRDHLATAPCGVLATRAHGRDHSRRPDDLRLRRGDDAVAIFKPTGVVIARNRLLAGRSRVMVLESERAKTRTAEKLARRPGSVHARREQFDGDRLDERMQTVADRDVQFVDRISRHLRKQQ
jgi:hypothetical protein